MSSLEDQITAYQRAVEAIPGTSTDALSESILKAVLARDRVAHELAGCHPSTETLLSVVKADKALQAKAKAVGKFVGASTFADWRSARQMVTWAGEPQRQVEPWWWRLEAFGDGESWHRRALTVLLWACIAISLSFIVESVRRFLTGGVDVLGTALQGLLTLFVGGTLVQFAAQLAAVRSGGAEKPDERPPLKPRLILPAVSIVAALVLWFLLPPVAGYISDLGVVERGKGKVSNPIGYYQRTLSLKPDDAIAHYNLAQAYEAVSELDQAETEYRAAIRWDESLAIAYDRLARLNILRRKDNVTALRLLKTGLAKLDVQKQAGHVSEDGYKRINVSLLRNEAWAYLGLNYLTQAEDVLREALEMQSGSAGVHCLLAQVLDAKMKAAKEKQGAKGTKEQEGKESSEVAQAFQECISLSYGQEDFEPDWLALAQDWLDRKDTEKEQTGEASSPRTTPRAKGKR
jgi:tetratricopeptide (TPR) repeat protein